MPQGLQIWRGDGKLIFDASRSLCRVLGNIDLTEAKGKVYCDDKRKLASVYRISNEQTYPVKLTIVADGIEWEYREDMYIGHKKDYKYGMRLMYGSY